MQGVLVHTIGTFSIWCKSAEELASINNGFNIQVTCFVFGRNLYRIEERAGRYGCNSFFSCHNDRFIPGDILTLIRDE